MQRISEFTRRLYFPFLLIIVAVYGWHPISGGDDFWAHAAIGRWTLEHGHAPRETIYLWSDRVPWVFHSYLAGVWFCFMLNSGGPYMALVFNVVIAALPFVAIWLFFSKRAPISSLHAIFFAIAIYVSAVRFHLRPEMFTCLFLTLTLLFLLQDKPRKWQYIALPLMFALWPNLHAGIALGIAVLWLGTLLNAAQNRRFDMASFGLAVACTVIPLFSQPYGPGYIQTYSSTMGTTAHIVEWLPFWKKPTLTPQIVEGMLFLLCSAVIMQVINPQRRWMALGATLLMFAAFMQQRRQLSLASATALVGISTCWALMKGENLYKLINQKRPLPLEMRLIGRLTAYGLLVVIMLSAPKPQLQALGDDVPVQLSQFLLTQAPKGRILNDYESSAALEWFLQGKRDIYIDLINAYDPKLLTKYIALSSADTKALKLLEEEKIQVIALRPLKQKTVWDKNGSSHKDDSGDALYPFVTWVSKSPNWQLIYNAKDGKVWKRVSSPKQQPKHSAARQ